MGAKKGEGDLSSKSGTLCQSTFGEESEEDSGPEVDSDVSISSFSTDPTDEDKNEDLGGDVIPASNGGQMKKKQRKRRGRKESEEEENGGSGNNGKRKKNEGDGKSQRTIAIRKHKAEMCYPKGTFLIRLHDLDSAFGSNCIWIVDNHQLIQKYVHETSHDQGDTRIYVKTNAYAGWQCSEPWHYFQLTPVEWDEEKVKIVAVSDVRLKAARENEKMHEEGKEMKKEEM